MNKNIRLVAAMMVAISLTGCGSSTQEILKTQLVDTLSKKEVNDYYKKSLAIKDINVHNNTENETVELREVDEKEKSSILKEVSRVESILSSDKYILDNYFNQQMFEYMKIQMDDRTYTRKEVSKIGGIRDKYVVDIIYTGKAKKTGTLKEDSKYLGVHGAFKRDKQLIPYKDNVYINKINKEVQKQQDTINAQIKKGIIVSEESIKRLDGTINCRVFNSLFGASLSETAIMPTLDMVFTPSATGGSLTGYGILPQGGNGLSKFGINRDSLNMNMTVRYVLSKDLETGSVHIQDIYVKDKSIEGLKETDYTGIFPEFIETEIDIIIDRADRIKSNDDIAGLANCEVYKDLRNTVYWGHLFNNAYYQPTSKVTKYMGRDGNFYLVEVTSNIKEDIKNDKAGQGVFQEKYIVMLEHQDMESKLSIVDWINTDRQTLSEPSIDFGSNLEKRFEYLSLASKVPENVKQPIKDSLSQLYKYGETKDWNGYYGCLNTDTELLSKTRRDDIYLTTKSWLNRRGSEKEFEYIGAVTDWISGTSSQVELLTEELINYKGTDKAQLMTNYYLISNFEDRWVVDEIKNVELEDIEGAEKIDELKNKINSYSSYTSSGNQETPKLEETTDEQSNSISEDSNVSGEETNKNEEKLEEQSDSLSDNTNNGANKSNE